MTKRPNPMIRILEEKVLIGTMALYGSQAELSESVPRQWQDFRMANPGLDNNAEFYGASPCSDDGKIHYLTGIAPRGPANRLQGDRITLDSGEYAFVQVQDGSHLRETWKWLLEEWLPSSGRREKQAPEFEKFSWISDVGTPIGPIEIWIPLAPLSTVLSR